MTTLDRGLFVKTLNLLAARLKASSVDPVRAAVKKYVFVMPRVKTVYSDETDKTRRLLLLSDSITKTEDIPEDLMRVFEEYQAEVIPYTLKLGYEYYTAEEVLRRLLPEGIDVPGSFETVGHIAHLNLRDEHEPYKHLIGQVILDKSPSIRTVVNKIGTIDSTFRFFAMEVLAGEPSTMVQVKEEGCRFEFDYAKVYWNSRLQFEHARLVKLFTKGQRICDVFCGVGPFALPSARKACIVYANDLNPESIKWITHNSALNKISKDNLSIHNMDGREFIRRSLETLRAKEGDEASFDHYVMNLPAIAYQFLDVIAELVQEGKLVKPCRVHCYTFVKMEGDPVANIEEGLGFPVHRESSDAKHVRTVAPNKDMYCVSFTVPVPHKRPKPTDDVSDN